MNPSAVAAWTLLGGHLVQAQPMLEKICGPDSSSANFMGDTEFDDYEDCLSTVIYLESVKPGILDQPILSVDDCDMIPQRGQFVGTHLKDGLKMVQYACCEGEPSSSGLCGDNFPDGAMCANPGQFMPGDVSGIKHCVGEFSMEDDCMFDGISGWDSEKEECDVGRMDLAPEYMTAACSEMGGEMKDIMCYQTAIWMTQQQQNMTQMCEDRGTRMTLEISGEQCCSDQESIVNECPPPPAVQFCQDMLNFDRDEKIGDMPFCSGGPDEDLNEELACTQAGGTLDHRTCGMVSDFLMVRNGTEWPDCGMEGYDVVYGMATSWCCRGGDVNTFSCEPPTPDGGGGGCTTASADAIRQVRMKGFEPRFCN